MEHIDAALLRRWKLRCVILDLDNTIVPWHTADVRPNIVEWIEKIRRTGIRFCLLTNNYGAQAVSVANTLSMPLVKGALKPLPSAFRRALEALGGAPAHSAVIGDQLFTDVLGGKLLDMRAVLVAPLGLREFPTTRFLRMLEAPILARIKRSAENRSGR